METKGAYCVFVAAEAVMAGYGASVSKQVQESSTRYLKIVLHPFCALFHA
jgi:hypothetical protein